MKLPETVFQVDKVFIQNLLVLSGGVMKYLIGLRVVVLLNQRCMPFDRQVTFLKEVFQVVICGWKNATTASLHPVALRTRVPRSIYSFKHKRLEHFPCSWFFPLLGY